MTEQPNTPGLWLTISELAEHKGLAKSAISERVARLTAAGLLTPRPGGGRTKLVNVAEFDRAVGQAGDLARTQGALTRRNTVSVASEAPPAAESGDPVYTREQARKMAYAADLAKLELDERLGRVVNRDEMSAALVECGTAIASAIDGFVFRSDDVAAAVAAEGVTGARRLHKQMAHDLRTKVAQVLAGLAARELPEPLAGPSSAAAALAGPQSDDAISVGIV